MKYSEARAKIKTGDMLLWRNHAGGSLRSVIERWFVSHGTASPHTHVGMALVALGRVWVMDITTKGCAPRLLSEEGAFDWIQAPKELSEAAQDYAFSCFGKWVYSRLQAVLGALKRLAIGADMNGQCAEYFLAICAVDNMAPTDTATPAACALGGMLNWGPMTMVTPD